MRETFTKSFRNDKYLYLYEKIPTFGHARGQFLNISGKKVFFLLNFSYKKLF